MDSMEDIYVCLASGLDAQKCGQ
jgi:hypothetical protein